MPQARERHFNNGRDSRLAVAENAPQFYPNVSYANQVVGTAWCCGYMSLRHQPIPSDTTAIRKPVRGAEALKSDLKVSQDWFMAYKAEMSEYLF